MIQEVEIRNKLSLFADGKLPLWGFYNWLEKASLNMHLDSLPEAIDLVGDIKLLYAEYDARDIGKDELIAQLMELGKSIARPEIISEMDVTLPQNILTVFDVSWRKHAEQGSLVAAFSGKTEYSVQDVSTFKMIWSPGVSQGVALPVAP